MCIRDRWEEGLTASRIATELGEVTRNAVIGKAHRLGLSGRMVSKKSNSGVSIIRKKRVNINSLLCILTIILILWQIALCQSR